MGSAALTSYSLDAALDAVPPSAAVRDIHAAYSEAVRSLLRQGAQLAAAGLHQQAARLVVTADELERHGTLEIQSAGRVVV